MFKDFLQNPIFKDPRGTIVESFKNAWAGKEELNIIFWWWGAFPYAISYFIIHTIIMNNPIVIIDWIISFLTISYFIFHIILIRKNLPKSPKLSKEEQEKLKAEKRKELPKKVLRKLLLKEPMTQWKPHMVFGAIDLFIIATYLNYLF